MWNKSLRLSLIFFIYQSLLNAEKDIPFVAPQYDIFFETITSEFPKVFFDEQDTNLNDSRLHLLTEELNQEVSYFLSNFEEYSVLVKNVLVDNSKTFDLIQAFIYCYLQEKDRVGVDEKTISQYIKLAEDFMVSANVRLIHAVLSKL